MQQPNIFLAGLAGVAAFLGTVCVLGTAVLYVVVVFLIGPHGVGLLPEWSHLPVLAFCALAVGYVGFKVAKWTHSILARRTGAI